MKLNPQQLSTQLKQGLAKIYLICGDEHLLVQESRDLLVEFAQSAGYSERQSYHATSDFNWDTLLAEITLQSLFSDKTLLELRIPTGKPGKQGCAAIETFLANVPPDKILLIVTPKLDASQQKTKWVKAIEQQGVMVTVWPIETAQLPSWVKQRLAKAKLSTTPEGLRLIVEQTQGNLLACDQEITKLSLLYGERALSFEEIHAAIGDHARFDLYQLVDQALLGHPEACVRMLGQLQASGTETTLLLWALTRELRQLIHLSSLMSRGERFESACTKLFVWKTRQSLYQTALRRLTQPKLLATLQHAATIDLQTKGLQSGNVWLGLNEIVLSLAGCSLATAATTC